VQLVALAREAEEKENMAAPEKSVIGEIDQKVMQGILDRFQVTDESRKEQAMKLNAAEYRTFVRQDLHTFIERSFYELNPIPVPVNWHIELIASELEACRRVRPNGSSSMCPHARSNPTVPQ